MRFDRLLLVGTALTALTPFAAYAQDAQTTPGSDANEIAATEETIVVTGSRIARPNLDNTAPTVSIGEAALEAQGFENFADVAATLPQFAPSFGASRTQSTFSGAASSGLNTTNLRNLGSSRTLVLINGRRAPQGFPTFNLIDFNLLPTANVERLEVITGGASAIYGSDAIAGVVNIITKKNFEGLEVGASYGIAEAGDNKNPNANIMFGSKFGDGGHMTLTTQYTYEGLVSCADRYLCAEDFAFTNPATGPIRGPAARSGVPLGGRFFAGSGSFTRDPATGQYVSFNVPAYGYNRNAQRTLAIPTRRFMVAAEAEYPISDAIEAFAEVNYGRSSTKAPFEAAPFSSDTNVFGGNATTPGLQPTIPITNPFIPAAVRAALTPAQIASGGIQWSQRFEQLGARGATNTRDAARFAGGLRGDFDILGDRTWNWETSYVYARHQLTSNTNGLVGTEQLYYGLRVEPNPTQPGQFRCTDAGARAAGCVPINPFLPYTQDQIDYLVVDAGQTGTSVQHDAQAFVSGELFDLPAGAISTALGLEYRTFSGNLDYDELINRGLTTGNQIGDVEFQKTRTKEAFAEVIVPVLKDIPGIQSLTLEGAYRISDPDNGDSYDTWRYGGTWEPISGLRLRGNRARAVRAPAPGDLSGVGQTFGVVNDPCTAARRNANATRAANCAADGVPATYAPPLTVEQGVQGFVGGNPNLTPEVATTLTYGLVFAPEFLPGFTLTVDRFEIELEEVITTVGRQLKANLCYDTTDRQFCGDLTRGTDPAVPGATYVLKSVNDQNANVAAINIKGFDVEARYGFDAPNLLGDEPAQLSLQAIATIYDKAEQISLAGQEPTDLLGAAGGSTSTQGYIKFQGNANVGYQAGGFGLNYNLRYIGRADASPFLEGFPKIPDAWYHNARLSYAVTENAELYFGVNNIGDNKPPFFPTGSSGTQALDTIPAFYDVFGRSYYTGVTFKF
jgi:outer membrane receptor protein involved in Fe transport